MIIAVIGDYESPEYKDLVQRVKISQPEEHVLDLGRHKSFNWKKLLDARFADIETAHQVIICSDWRNHFDAKRDITQAQLLNKEIFIDRDGQFLQFPENANRL